MELAQRIEHTLLKPEATVKDIMRLCDEAQQYHLYAVCVNPCYVPLAKHLLQGTEVKVVTVVGFPLGATFSSVKALEAKTAMEEGKIAYAGKYSAPDYEQILAAGCRLAIENTMILHTPEVKEQLEHFGIPVLVERSSYESDPLARMEWIKLYGILLGREEQAEQVFSAQETAVQPILSQKPTGKSCAFFSLTTNNLATVRKGSDYVARMIEVAGGSYVFADLTDNGNSLATMNLPLEDFYAGAKDADVLIYNSAIEGMIASVSQLTERFPLLNEFKAVQNGQVWCTTQSLFQQSMELADLIVDMNRVFTKGTPAASTLKFLTHVD